MPVEDEKDGAEPCRFGDSLGQAGMPNLLATLPCLYMVYLVTPSGREEYGE